MNGYEQAWLQPWLKPRLGSSACSINACTGTQAAVDVKRSEIDILRYVSLVNDSSHHVEKGVQSKEGVRIMQDSRLVRNRNVQ
jgi:hypothetical protein